MGGELGAPRARRGSVMLLPPALFLGIVLSGRPTLPLSVTSAARLPPSNTARVAPVHLCGGSDPDKDADESKADAKKAWLSKRDQSSMKGKAGPAAGNSKKKPLYEVGEEAPAPGREKEYEAFKQDAAAACAGGPSFVPPPIDSDRRSRSPGLQRNFYDVPTSDFKRPHGMGAAPPPQQQQTRDPAPPAGGPGPTAASPAASAGSRRRR